MKQMIGKKILIVDDSAVERLILKNIALKMGFEVYEADNGNKGVELAQNEDLGISLVLMDVVMGDGMNGFQAATKIVSGENSKHIPVIMCTSRTEEIDKLWGLKKGAKAYVTKPISEDNLVSEIEKLFP